MHNAKYRRRSIYSHHKKLLYNDLPLSLIMQIDCIYDKLLIIRQSDEDIVEKLSKACIMPYCIINTFGYRNKCKNEIDKYVSTEVVEYLIECFEKFMQKKSH